VGTSSARRAAETGVPDGEPTRRNRAVDYNTDRPHEALSWHRPHDLCLGLADPGVPHFTELHVTS
jgi:hypothetical protein